MPDSGFNIAAFQSLIGVASGLARPNKYEVAIAVTPLIALSVNDWIGPYAGITDGVAASNRLRFFCERAEVPGYEFGVDTMRMYGPAFKLPHIPLWSDSTFTFFVGGDYQERYFFEAWMYNVMDPITSDFNYVSEYGTSIDVITYDDTLTAQYVTTLIDAYPVSIRPIQLAWDGDNQVAKMDVTFTYKRAESFNGNGSVIDPTAAAGGRFIDTIGFKGKTLTQVIGNNNNQNPPENTQPTPNPNG